MTSFLKWSLLQAALALAFASCSTTRSPEALHLFRSALRKDLIGCYALFDARGHFLDSSYYNASPLIRLDSTPAWGTDHDSQPGIIRGMLRLDSSGRRLDPVNPAFHLGPAWWVDSLTHTLRISFSNGFSGAALNLVATQGSEDTLRGHIEEHWDFGPPFATNRGQGFAVRIPCSGS
jgi:hypothetical protein